MYITSQELNKRGTAVIREKLQENDEAVIRLKNEDTFVVMNFERYKQYREIELEHAWHEAQEDLANGDYTEESVEEHLKEIENEIFQNTVSQKV